MKAVLCLLIGVLLASTVQLWIANDKAMDEISKWNLYMVTVEREAIEAAKWKAAFRKLAQQTERYSQLMQVANELLGTPDDILYFLHEAEEHLQPGTLFNGKTFISSRYGDDVLKHKYRIHKGIDIVPTGDRTVFPLCPGTIVDCGFDPVYGKYILIDHGGGFETFYSHFEIIYWQDVTRKAVIGERVTPADRIGKAGETGKVTGMHLHFEIRYNGNTINPEPFFLRTLSTSARITSHKQEKV